MKNLFGLIIVGLGLTSCINQFNTGFKTDDYNQSVQNRGLQEEGLVVVEGNNLGAVNTTDSVIDEPDCPKWGVGVNVKSSTGDRSYTFDEEDKKCKKAEILFDGKDDRFSRAADPFVDIIFNDGYGKVSAENNFEKTAKTSLLLTNVERDYSINDGLAKKAYDEMGKLGIDYKEIETAEALNKKEIIDFAVNEAAKQNKEESMAYARELARAGIEKETEKLKKEQDQLKQDLTLSKDQISNALEELTKRTQELIKLSKEYQALKREKEIQDNSYKEKILMLEKRVEDYAQLALLLKKQNQRLALSGEQANKIIETDLKSAEKDAENLRYLTMMKKAEEIKTDEKLASALHDSQKKALQRKAQRLQTQADALAYHARADKVFNKDMDKIYKQLKEGKQPNFEAKLARVVGVDVNTEPTLKHVQLVLNEKNRSIKDILDEILLDIQPMVGTWKVDVQLASHNQKILKEEWNIAAEVTLFEFFDYIKSRVKEIHGVNLQIETYPETRKIVITDNF